MYSWNVIKWFTTVWWCLCFDYELISGSCTRWNFILGDNPRDGCLQNTHKSGVDSLEISRHEVTKIESEACTGGQKHLSSHRQGWSLISVKLHPIKLGGNTLQTWKSLTFLFPDGFCCCTFWKINGKRVTSDSAESTRQSACETFPCTSSPGPPQTNSRLHFKYIAGLLGNPLLLFILPSLGD